MAGYQNHALTWSIDDVTIGSMIPLQIATKWTLASKELKLQGARTFNTI